MQNCAKRCWPQRSVAGARAEGPPGQDHTVDAESTDNEADAKGITRSSVGGRLRCSPADVTGTFFTGNDACCRWALSPWTTVTAVSDSGVSDAARSNRKSQHPATAASKHTAAAMAMADRSSGGVRTRLNPTVPQL
jgi:hypothetical protein